MKTRKRFIRVVIAAAVVILLLVRFVGKWRYDVTAVSYADVDSMSLPLQLEMVC